MKPDAAFAVLADHCGFAMEFANLVTAGVLPKAAALVPLSHRTVATESAHRGYATGFAAQLLAAAAFAGVSAAVMEFAMSPARRRGVIVSRLCARTDGRSVSNGMADVQRRIQMRGALRLEEWIYRDRHCRIEREDLCSA
ncbi:hypothetical protein SAMN05444161_8431 [Rhizobiales bacterium GAS191]|nr:hypothetical protein SAMN05444161_8431 [Rhizobiales bacterium GAS191]